MGDPAVNEIAVHGRAAVEARAISFDYLQALGNFLANLSQKAFVR